MTLPREIKVGAFVFLGIVVMSLVVFMIGDEARLFESKVEYHAYFQDVQGLKRGSPVRMGGVDIGRVEAVGYTEEAADARLEVKMSIVEAEARRIRQDSIATVANRGLLGDKMITISVGSPEAPDLPPESTIRSEEPQDLSIMMDKLAVIGDKAEQVMRNLEKTTNTLSEDEFRQDVKDSVHSLRNVLHSLDEGEGFASKILNDPEQSARIERSIQNIERTTARLDQATAGLDQAIDQVNTGPGFAHDLLYGDTGTKALAEIGHAAGEVATTLEGVREGNGLARSFIYGDDESQQIMSNLNELSRELKGVVADMRAGKGTLGALLVDPSVYEDLKMLLGNVQRNKALRALVRYSITRDEKVEPIEVVDPKPATPAVERASGGDEAELSRSE